MYIALRFEIDQSEERRKRNRNRISFGANMISMHGPMPLPRNPPTTSSNARTEKREPERSSDIVSKLLSDGCLLWAMREPSVAREGTAASTAGHMHSPNGRRVAPKDPQSHPAATKNRSLSSFREQTKTKLARSKSMIVD